MGTSKGENHFCCLFWKLLFLKSFYCFQFPWNVRYSVLEIFNYIPWSSLWQSLCPIATQILLTQNLKTRNISASFNLVEKYPIHVNPVMFITNIKINDGPKSNKIFDKPSVSDYTCLWISSNQANECPQVCMFPRISEKFLMINQRKIFIEHFRTK